MDLLLIRDTFTHKSTTGILYLDGIKECYTLEDVQRPPEIKIPGQTAIPLGEYDVDITMSKRFGRSMPLIKDVPNFSGIRIHSGNTDKDTEGCILVGMQRGIDCVSDSKTAFKELFIKLNIALTHGPVRIKITEKR